MYIFSSFGLWPQIDFIYFTKYGEILASQLSDVTFILRDCMRAPQFGKFVSLSAV